MAEKQTGQPKVNESGRPETGGGEGRKEVTGIVPDDVRVDPDITEGHPGYQESGDSSLDASQQSEDRSDREKNSP
jgi:hypothetical protein